MANFYFDPSVANPKSSLEKYLVPVSSQMSLSSPTSGGCYKKILADREVFRTILQSVASKNTEQVNLTLLIVFCNDLLKRNFRFS